MSQSMEFQVTPLRGHDGNEHNIMQFQFSDSDDFISYRTNEYWENVIKEMTDSNFDELITRENERATTYFRLLTNNIIESYNTILMDDADFYELQKSNKYKLTPDDIINYDYDQPPLDDNYDTGEYHIIFNRVSMFDYDYKDDISNDYEQYNDNMSDCNEYWMYF